MNGDENVLRNIEIRARRRRAKGKAATVMLSIVRMEDGEERILGQREWSPEAGVFGKAAMQNGWVWTLFRVLFDALNAVGESKNHGLVGFSVGMATHSSDFVIYFRVATEIGSQFPPPIGRKHPRSRRIVVADLLESIEASYARQWVSQASSGMMGNAV